MRIFLSQSQQSKNSEETEVSKPKEERSSDLSDCGAEAPESEILPAVKKAPVVACNLTAGVAEFAEKEIFEDKKKPPEIKLDEEVEFHQASQSGQTSGTKSQNVTEDQSFEKKPISEAPSSSGTKVKDPIVATDCQKDETDRREKKRPCTGDIGSDQNDRKLSSKKIKQEKARASASQIQTPQGRKLWQSGNNSSMGRGHDWNDSFPPRSYRGRDGSVDEIEVRNDSRFFDLHEENDPASAHASDEAAFFELALKKRGLEIVEQAGDGNCLFRAVSLQVYGDSSMHEEVRSKCMDFMAKDEAHFSHFVTGEPFFHYIERKRHDGVHGNNPEIQAISEMYNRPVEVYVPDKGGEPLNIFHAEYKTSDAPIRLSYHDGNHYNAVIDPLYPTAGLGLGLPGLKPGLADRLQVAKAMTESDRIADELDYQRAMKESHNEQVQKVILESKITNEKIYEDKALVLSDIDATNFELEQVMLANSMCYGNGKPSEKQDWSSPASLNTSQDFASIPTEHNEASHIENEAMSPYASFGGPSATATVATAEPRGDEYPESIQELVVNGFELSRVVQAYELVGDNFDDMLAFLMSSHS
mmetsp:Transcript_25276/g.38861  ORF Transcript_25276/g.38861 Transcript_25276/m.38861 type:complete len:586 (-) Transcript_25276:400-2157(-)